MLRAVPIFTTFFLFLAFLLLLLVSLSAPIIHSLYLFRLDVKLDSSLLDSNVAGSVSFGVWGYCLSPIESSILSIEHSTSGECSDRHVGYTFDDNIASALRLEGLQDTISGVTTAALVIHPIAAGLAFIALLVSLFPLCRPANGHSSYRHISLASLSLSALAAIITTVVFLLDAIFVGGTRDRIQDASDSTLELVWGNAVWLALVAAISLWIAFLLPLCFRRRFLRNKAQDND